MVQRVFAVVAVLLAFAQSGFAQGVVSGAVFEPDGAPVAGQQVYLTNVATQSQLTFDTLENGRFEFSGLPAAEYRLTSDGPGIGTLAIVLEDGERWHRDFKRTFGPFAFTWTIGPPSPPSAAPAAAPAVRPAGYRCSERGLPYCGPESLMQEFEAGEAARLRSRWLPPRLICCLGADYPPALLEAGIEGTVVMEARVGIDNTLVDLRVTAVDHPALVLEGIAQARRAYVEAGRAAGVPSEQPVTITVRYRLTDQ